MGKKTDALLKSVTDAGDACILSGNNLLKVLAVWPAVDAEWDKWEKEMSALDDYRKHPYMIKRGAVWDKGRQLALKLKADVHDLNMALGAFGTYLSKKEKSKNPFKSKTSLPGAKDMLKSYSKVAKEFSDLGMLGTKMFH